MRVLAQIDGGYFCAGFMMDDDVVVEAAPILRKPLMGKRRDEVRDICKAKGWKVGVVSEASDLEND